MSVACMFVYMFFSSTSLLHHLSCIQKVRDKNDDEIDVKVFSALARDKPTKHIDTRCARVTRCAPGGSDQAHQIHALHKYVNLLSPTCKASAWAWACTLTRKRDIISVGHPCGGMRTVHSRRAAAIPECETVHAACARDFYKYRTQARVHRRPIY